MAVWAKTEMMNEKEEMVSAITPLIVSASRSTDVPAFYSDWFMERLKAGFVKWTNPFNGAPSYVSFEQTRLIVFWSKNPEPMLKYLDELDAANLNYYFQFSLNDYDDERYEPSVPPLKQRIDTFIELSKRLGKDRVVWRFDPLLLTDRVSVGKLLEKIKRVGDQVAPHTSQLIFSFSDIERYQKVKRNLAQNNIEAREFDSNEMREVAQKISKLNQQWGLQLGTCAEQIDLDEFDIEHARCVDDRLIEKCFPDDAALMALIGKEPEQIDLFQNPLPKKRKRSLKDKGQREACGCIVSKDIGEYNTCPHSCVYCYANASPKSARRNFDQHKLNPHSPSIKG
jgi:DNA repair photolyase